ncbi:hypothetical protein [Streptomyces sp. NBC_00690]|uniref:hypothetical protein n=1 Tax=Streptomyces sp. NBC_00690 TaxID=2975808 RepID=UPI002E286508|nr:hypothetical protein [Streptomyces sp. NBC_00690]
MTSDDARLRQEAGHFVRWALAQKIARDLTFPAERWNGPSQPMDDEARWATARRPGSDWGVAKMPMSVRGVGPWSET